MALQTKTFSVGDFAYKSASNAYVLDLIITEESTSVEDNTSKISYKLQLRSGANNRFTANLPCSVTINGVTTSKTVAITAAYNHTYTLISGSATVAHNADGSFSLSVKGTTSAISNSYAPPALTVSGTVTLTAIPRASTVAATDANIGAKSTVVISRKSDNFTHSVAYKFGTLTGFITAAGGTASEETKFSATTVNFTIPDSFYAQIPNAASGTCTLTVKTYSGTAQVGDAKTDTFTVTAAKTLCAPTVSGTVEDTNEATLLLTGDKSKLVRYQSTALCTITAAAKNSASIVQKKIGGTVVTGSTRTIEKVELESIVFYAKDSRGYTAQTVPDTYTVIPYVDLTANVTAKRTDPTSGNAQLSVSGKWFNGSFGAVDNGLTVSCSVNGGDPVTLEPVAEGNTYTAAAELTGLDYLSAHTIQVTVTDAVQTVTKTVTVNKGIPVFDWGESDFQFHVPVKGTSFNSMRMKRLYVSGTASFYIKTKFDEWVTSDSGQYNYNRQAIFMFGMDNWNPVYGIITVANGGRLLWTGNSEDVTLSKEDGGYVKVTFAATCFDYLAFLSAEDFEVSTSL